MRSRELILSPYIRSVQLGGTAPAILYGYGGFSHAMTVRATSFSSVCETGCLFTKLITHLFHLLSSPTAFLLSVSFSFPRGKKHRHARVVSMAHVSRSAPPAPQLAHDLDQALQGRSCRRQHPRR